MVSDEADLRESDAPGRGTRRWFLAAATLIAVLSGIGHLFPDQRSALDDLTTLSLAYVLGWWALVDARRRGSPIPFLARQWFFLCPILVPGYAIWSRGWRGAGWVALLVAAWYLVINLSLFAAYFTIRALRTG